MKWPWVSRRAYDLVVEERDYLRQQVERLQEHHQRIDRIEHGVAEVPRRERPPMQPIPKSFLDKLNAWASPAICKANRDAAFRRHAQGVSWDVIEVEYDRKVVGGEEPEEEPEEVTSGS